MPAGNESEQDDRKLGQHKDEQPEGCGLGEAAGVADAELVDAEPIRWMSQRKLKSRYRIFPSMRVDAVEHEQAVREGAENFCGVFTDSLDATGQRVDEHIADGARNGPAEQCAGQALTMLHANELHNTGKLAVKHRSDDVGRNIARANPRSTGSEDHVSPLLFRLFNRLLQQVGIVGN